MTTLITLSALQTYIALIIGGVFTGLGSALGSYFANKGLIKTMESRIRKINKLLKKK